MVQGKESSSTSMSPFVRCCRDNCDLPFNPNLYTVNDPAQLINAVGINGEGVLQGHTVCETCGGTRRVLSGSLKPQT